jgi:hypothetical protein
MATKPATVARPVPTATLLLACLAVLLPGSGTAQEAAPPGAEDLAKQLSNPVASLVSLPFQMNWEQGVGPGEDTRTVLNIQPVMPFTLSPGMNLIARVIAPLVSQPPLSPGSAATFGLSDLLVSGFFSPSKPSALIWGVGPALSLPSTSDPTLGSGKWSAGPTFVVLRQDGPWTIGALANHLWSWAGDSDRGDVNQTFLQPFLALGAGHGVTLTLNTEATANWEAPDGEEWSVPINLVVSKVVRLGQRPLSVGAGGGYYVEGPEAGPEWKARAVFTLLFPR